MLLSSFGSGKTEAGTDEAGRGCLAGPVVAAAVILPPDYQNDLLRDSKKLRPAAREKLRQIIINEAVAWAEGIVSPEEIDEINILQASFLAMHRALETLQKVPEFILVDGNRFVPFGEIPHVCIIKGDDKYLSIAAASVLAKTRRDELMSREAEKHPGYGWETNFGYPTKAHYEGINRLGITDLHRKTFRLFKESDPQTELTFKTKN